MANSQSKFDLMVALKANAKDFKSGMGKAQRSLKGFVGQAAPAFGPLNSSAGRFLSTFSMGSQAIRSMIPAIKGVKGALMASGIGAALIAISAALAGVSAYLTKTTEGADKMNVAMSRVKAVGGTFFDRMIDGGKGFLKVLTGNKEGIDEIKNSFKGIFKEANKEQKQAAAIAKEENQLRKDKIDFIVREAKLNMEIADLIRKSKSLEYDRGERVAFLNKAIAKQNQLSDQQVQLATKELSIQKRRMDMGHNSYEDLEKYAMLQKDVFLTEKNRDDKNRELENRIREATNALNEQEKLLKKIGQDAVKIGQAVTDAFTTEQTSIPELTSDLRDLDREMTKVTSKKIKVDPEDFKGLKGVFTDLDNLTAVASSGIYGMSSAFSSMAAEGKMSMKGMVTSILSSIEGLIQGYLAQAIGAMIARSAALGPIAGLVAASAGVSGLMALWKTKVPSFASGGLAYGDTLARVGDYRNAAVDPEVISPLSKLKKIMGGGRLRGELRAEGTELVAMINNIDKRNKLIS